MYTFLVILIFIVCILLVLAVLIQNSKGGGLTAGFTGSSQIMGVRKTADFMEKATWYLAIGLIVLCMATNFSRPTAAGAKAEQSAAQKKAMEMGAPPVNPAGNQAPPPADNGAGQGQPATPAPTK